MNALIPFLSFCLFAIFSFARSQDLEWSTPEEAKFAIQSEENLLGLARAEAMKGDDAGVDRRLLSQDGKAGRIHSSVLLAQRAVNICAWLRNQNEYAASRRTAKRAVAFLAGMREDTESERVERLYWESVLRGDFLGQRRKALELLQEAESLAPDDDRIVENAIQLADALGEFGE